MRSLVASQRIPSFPRVAVILSQRIPSFPRVAVIFVQRGVNSLRTSVSRDDGQRAALHSCWEDGEQGKADRGRRKRMVACCRRRSVQTEVLRDSRGVAGDPRHCIPAPVRRACMTRVAARSTTPEAPGQPSACYGGVCMNGSRVCTDARLSRNVPVSVRPRAQGLTQRTMGRGPRWVSRCRPRGVASGGNHLVCALQGVQGGTDALSRVWDIHGASHR
jgi:hypothetical protein